MNRLNIALICQFKKNTDDTRVNNFKVNEVAKSFFKRFK